MYSKQDSIDVNFLKFSKTSGSSQSDFWNECSQLYDYVQ